MPATGPAGPRPSLRRRLPAARRARGLARALPRAVLGALLAASAGCAGEAEPARHLILITVDTWRGDHFLTERAGRPLTPELARFAAGGVRFTAAHSAGNETSPGIAGVMTGLLPRRSGVLRNAHVLQDRIPTLAEILHDAGFATEAVVSNFFLKAETGFDHGFEQYRLVHRRPKAEAAEVTDAALARVAARGEEVAGGRLFLWVHYIDPHGPYLPPDGDLRLFPAAAFAAARDLPLKPRRRQGGRGGIPSYQQVGQSPPSRDGRDYLARYAAEVHAMDREVARLLDGLDRSGVLERSVVVLTSDHGEALAGDHGFYFSHGNGLTQDQVHVPLVVSCPGCPRGQVVDRPVSTLGILPTVLPRLGVPLPEGHAIDGARLLEPGEEHLVYSQKLQQVALRRGAWKAIWNPRGRARLFNLDDDPAERHDLAAAHPERLDELARELRRLRAREILAQPRDRPSPPRRHRRDLEALGYL